MWCFNKVVAILLLVGCGCAPTPEGAERVATHTSGDVDEEHRALEGVWGQVRTVFEGKETKEDPQIRTLTFKGAEVVDYDKDAPKSIRRMKFEIDPTRRPKTMDIYFSGTKKPAKRIYELEDDTLRFAGTVSNEDYPEGFTGEGDGQMMIVYQRQR